ncbi:MAG: VWA domain-containing protein, partial [Gammaproteobacteria bacterium]|nr:VWA domain-containing protein [Gammaproteobacteria bacterium]
AMDTYDQAGLHRALSVITDVNRFIQYSHESRAGTTYEDKASVLLHFVNGLSGRKLKLDQAEQSWTDTETIYLPAIIAQLNTPAENFLLYKITTTYHWAQICFGTFRAPLYEIISSHDQADKFIALFHALDSLRLEACINRELPGLYRELQVIKPQLTTIPTTKTWLELNGYLSQPDITVHDIIHITQTKLNELTPPAPAFYQGCFNFQAINDTMSKRIEKEKALLRIHLAKLEQEIKHNKPESSKLKTEYKANNNPDSFPLDITLDEQPVAIPDHIKVLAQSIKLDLGDIPDEYLQPAGEGEYDPEFFKTDELDPDDVWKGTYHEDGAFLYNEWDYKRQHYKKNWCAVRELNITPVYDNFVQNTLDKYSGLIKHLRKTFEAMRDENRLQKRQTDGDDIDLDALVEALADSADGSEMTDRLFTRMHKTERNIAVVFMIDMSGSTKGWINDAERESLILLCEALESLDDRYAIYGFSGVARKRCELYKIKNFTEAYDAEIKARISGIQPKDYTRMGFAIRHLSKQLIEVDASTRILITISDGKPDDYDNYRGKYGIEDTRRALIEARRMGIHPYCITIDEKAREYLPHMYGAAAYTVINDVSQLPLKVSDIYRKLTV